MEKIKILFKKLLEHLRWLYYGAFMNDNYIMEEEPGTISPVVEEPIKEEPPVEEKAKTTPKKKTKRKTTPKVKE